MTHRRPGACLLAAALVTLVVVSMSPSLSSAHAAEASRVEELEKRVQELERMLAELRAEGTSPDRLGELERQIQILAREIENLQLGEAAPVAAERGEYGLGPAASKVYGVKRGVSIGGYGEMLYENFSSTREDGSPSGRRDQLDFLRAIVYVGYKFSDKIVFNSEIEFEHAATGQGGEVSVEFAYIDFLLGDAFNVRAGMVLLPMGFINELHEPPIFLGARRPYVEQRLIPSTWRENGVGVFGDLGPVEYRVYLVNGMAAVRGTSSSASGFSASGIRGGRTKGAFSAAEDFALTGRVDWEPMPSLTVGGSFYAGNSGQSALIPSSGETLDASTRLISLHGEYRWRGFQTRGVWVRSSIGDVAGINEIQGFAGAQSVGERQYGWYGEFGYDLLAARPGTQAVIPYLRYERFDTQHRVPAGFASNPANDVTVTTLGVAWKPILNVVVKADWNRIENKARTGVDQFNVALGYLF